MSKIKKAIHYTQRHQATNESRKNETFLSELTQVRQERIRHQKSLTFRISSVLRSSLVRILSAICNETVVLQLCVKGISDDRNLQARVLERLHQLEYRQFRSKFEEGNNHLRNNGIAVAIQRRETSRFVIARPQRGRGNLVQAVAFSPMAFLLSTIIPRDSHVASLLGMTNLGALWQ